MGNFVKRWLVALAAVALVATAATAAEAGARPSPAAAQDDRPAQGEQSTPQPSGRGKRTVLHFDDDSIRGDITRPDGELVQAPRKISESSLLRIRRSFLDRALAGAARGH